VEGDIFLKCWKSVCSSVFSGD